MLIFLDTEFTCLPGRPLSTLPGSGPLSTAVCRQPKLISVGLVAEDGKHEFYAEIERGQGWDWTDCSDFVMLEVVPLLKGGKCAMRPEALKARLIGWLDSMPADLTLACDSYIDVEFMKAVFGQDWPAKLNKKVCDLRPMLDMGAAFDHAFVECQRGRGGHEHNALDDAYGNRAGWLAWRSAKQRPA